MLQQIIQQLNVQRIKFPVVHRGGKKSYGNIANLIIMKPMRLFREENWKIANIVILRKALEVNKILKQTDEPDIMIECMANQRLLELHLRRWQRKF